MPSISRVRFTNVVYDNGNKRYIDTTFRFDGYNGIILLENGAGKTVFVQTLIQAVLPHKTVAQRKIQETLQLSNNIAHIAVEWILEDQPRRYALTAVSLFMNSRENLASQEFAMEYAGDSADRLDTLPFTRQEGGQKRPASREEMAAYFRGVAERSMLAKFFSESDTLLAYGKYLEEHFKIIPSEWSKIAAINEAEGGVEAYFENCRTTNELVDRLLLPTVEEGCRAGGTAEQGNGFAELFEKQREHFKQQIRLQKRIEEMQSILVQLDAYTEVQRGQYLAEQKMAGVNGQLKAFYGQVDDAQEKGQEQQRIFDGQLSDLQQKQRENQQALDACLVAEAWQKSEALQQEENRSRQDFQTVEEERLQGEQRLRTLKLARLQRDMQQSEQQAAGQQAALAELEQDAEAQELEAALRHNSGCLHGWFTTAEKKLQEQLNLLEGQLQHSRSEQEQMFRTRQQCEEERRQAALQAGSKEGEIRTLLEQQEAIERELFPDEVNRDTRLQQSVWQQEQQKLSADIQGYEENIQLYEADQQKLMELLPIQQAEAAAWEKDAGAIDTQLKVIESRATALLAKFQQWPQCANVAKTALELYQRAEFFQNQLGDGIVLLQDQAKELSYACRQAHRSLDLYGGLEAFSADPVLEQKLEDMGRDFVFLKSGAELFRQYSREGSREQQDLYESYPFWASSVVTTEDDLTEVRERLQAAADDFIQPVFLLTERELRAVLEGAEPVPQRQIIPDYWQNIIPERFRSWMDALQENAAELDQKQQENHQLLGQMRGTAEDLQAFLRAVPFSEYQELQSSQRNLLEKLEIQQRKMEQNRISLEQDRQNLVKYQDNLYRARQQQTELQYKLQRTQEYFALQEKQRQAIAERKTIMDRITLLQTNAARLEKDQQMLQKNLQHLLDDRTRQKSELRQLKQRLYYAEAQEADIIADERSYETLAERQRQLQSRLEGCNASRGRIESELANARRAVSRLQEEITALREESGQPLEAALPYPENGLEEEARLRREKKSRQQACDTARRVWEQKKQAADKAQGAWEAEKQRYDKKYEAMIEFQEALREVRRNLEAEYHRLEQQRMACEQAVRENQRETAQLAALAQLMDRKNERLQFAVDAVEAAVLAEEWKSADSQKLSAVIRPKLDEAEQDFAAVAEKRLLSQQKKDEFISSCERTIREEKMRRRVADGIRSKQGYEEFVDWKDAITNNIHQIIGLSESERKEHYEHIERMVEHMSLYLQEICRGLLELAAKTRIRVGEGTKDIYSIHIPQWKEAEARSVIRTYLGELTKKLDMPEYLDENGHEDSVKVKKELQRLLRTQQIMNRVLGEHAVKVKCRKATSAQLFSERPFSWEESNHWSGGEMWSKNMALFLGCLNYLSEKRCHVKRTKYNNRVVLADNPFGKASSDHVLDPVFFIAEELGFQLIALTAHEDGSFIRKYFPVVYSCRFANIAGQKGQVLQPHQEIKTAFFEEQHPESLGRLEDYEELGLF